MSTKPHTNKPAIQILKASEREDWKFIREVCCATANSGGPIDPARWPFFGEWWVGAYERLRPEWAYLATDTATATDTKLGYLTGCPDTSRFDREKWWLSDLPLYFKIRMGAFTANADTDRWRRRFEGKEKWPEACFNRDTTREVLEKYPAHLHINLLPAARGTGTGRMLIERYAEDLRGIGVPGIHLYCGQGPLEFYFKTGFTEVDRIEYRPGVWVYRLARPV